MASRLATTSAGRRVLHGIASRFPGIHPILCNSIPKSGTHLIQGMISALPRHTVHQRNLYWYYLNRKDFDPSGNGATARPAQHERILRAIRPGEVMRGHVEHHEVLADTIRSLAVRHVLIVRDPRDIVVSLLHWWARRTDVNAAPVRYFNTLRDRDLRLRYLIHGDRGLTDSVPPVPPLPDIGQRMASWLPWTTEPDCLVVRFEDLTRDERANEYVRIAQHVAPGIDERAAVEAMAGGADPRRSRTFRQGLVGTFAGELDTEMIRDVEVLCRDFMARLGYPAATR